MVVVDLDVILLIVCEFGYGKCMNFGFNLSVDDVEDDDEFLFFSCY